MLRNKKSKFLLLAMTIALSGSILAGCGSTSTSNQASSGSKVIKVNIGADPKTIDRGRA